MVNAPRDGALETTGEVDSASVPEATDESTSTGLSTGCPVGCGPDGHEPGCTVGRRLGPVKCWACLALPFSARDTMHDCSEYCPDAGGERT